MLRDQIVPAIQAATRYNFEHNGINNGEQAHYGRNVRNYLETVFKTDRKGKIEW